MTEESKQYDSERRDFLNDEPLFFKPPKSMDEYYNQAIDDALKIVKKHWGSSLIIAELKALKKKP